VPDSAGITKASPVRAAARLSVGVGRADVPNEVPERRLRHARL